MPNSNGEPSLAEIVPEDSSQHTLGIEATIPQGSICNACGSPVEQGDSFCPACGGSIESNQEKQEQELLEASLVETHFECQNCGAEVSENDQQRSYVCAFCGSTYVRQRDAKVTGRKEPEFIIGFKITKEQAERKLQDWLSHYWFRPKDLKISSLKAQIRGIYLPFWSFSMLAQSTWSASIGEYWYKTETRTVTRNGKTQLESRRVRKTEWWPLSGKHHKYYSGYLVSASKGLDQADADSIKPFHLAGLKRYRPYFLAGWLSEEYSIESDVALETCKSFFYQNEQSNIGAFLPGDTYSGLEVQTWFSSINNDLILLPVHILSINYQDKVYRFLVNGQTGKTTGSRPRSKKQIGIVALAAFLAALVILVAFLMTR